jgi:hypothetical protein
MSFSGDVSNKNIKEIGGLEERLEMLSKLCDKARTVGQEQSDMAQVFYTYVPGSQHNYSYSIAVKYSSSNNC